ncbi:hypothetical protein F5Y13DRAFT_193718 [Hypoxylon sp. FL1857]|nr:hypothetical protein F5Y13DRAFT_193718 [Hypoxylon sp. FL1857]
MASRQSQYQQNGGLHADLTFHSESTLAHDLHSDRLGTATPNSTSHQELDRASNIPKVQKDSILNSFTRWLGKYTGRNSKSNERPRISDPIILKPQAPLYRKSLLVERTPQWQHESRIIPEIVAPKQQPQPSQGQTTQEQKLGKSPEALSSHPVGTWLDSMGGKFSPKKILLKSTSSDVDTRATVHSEASRYSRIPVATGSNLGQSANISRQKAVHIKAETRKGRTYLDQRLPRDLYEFPDPEAWGSGDLEKGNDNHGGFWEDAGFDDVYEPKPEPKLNTRTNPIPTIVVTKPDDKGKRTVHRHVNPQDYLTVDYCYKVLWEGQKSEVRGLQNTVNFLLPLGWLVAEAEGIDHRDVTLLEDTLKTIIDDRDKLFDLFPLAQILADDQNVDVTDFKALYQAMYNVLEDRDNARRAAEYHNSTRRRLEGRVTQLERERREGNTHDEDDEDYIRL